MWDIAKILSVTPATVVYWMDRHNLRRRSRSDCAYVKQNPNGDPFRIKNKLTMRDKELLLSGLMLYWTEGTKRNRHVVQLANLDPRMIWLFLKFLREICRIDESKIRLYVRAYRKFNRTIAQSYWAGYLRIPKKQVFVYRHIDRRSRINKQWSKYGIATLQFANMRLKDWLENEISRYLSKLRV